jgi:hypothetical protein
MDFALATSHNIVESVTAHWLGECLDDKFLRTVDACDCGHAGGFMPGALP